MLNREAYIEKMKTQLDDLNVEMDKLGARAKEARADARAKYQEEMQKLRDQSKLSLEKLDEIKAASEDSWEGLVVGAEKMREAFVHSFHYFKSQF